MKDADHSVLLGVCSQVARLAEAGRPLAGELAQIAERSSGAYAQALRDVDARVQAGEPLTAALASGEGEHYRVLAATIEAGERSKALGDVLEAYVVCFRALRAAKKSLLSALIYPVLLVVTMTVSLTAVFWNLIPQYGTMYASFDQDLPWWLNSLSTLHSYTWFVAIGSLLAGAVPIACVLVHHFGRNRRGLPRSGATRRYLQSLGTKVAAAMVAAGVDSETLRKLAMAASGAPSTADTGFPSDGELGNLSEESTAVLRALDVGQIEQSEAVNFLQKIAEQLSASAQLGALRESRWLPSIVAGMVGCVAVLIYTFLIYLPWLCLLLRIEQAGAQ